jgi:DNA-binding Lrp family transcriptional regulator
MMGKFLMSDEDTLRLIKPDPELLIKDLATLKIVTDSFRLQLLNYLAEPHTVKEVADSLNIPPFKLYYHFNLLEQHGIIRIVGTRMVSAIPEKFYQATAYQLRTDPAIFSTNNDPEQRGLAVYLDSILDATKNDIKRAVQEGVLDMTQTKGRISSLLSIRGFARLNPVKAEEVYLKLIEMVKNITDSESEIEDKDSRNYEFAIIYFPTAVDESAE